MSVVPHSSETVTAQLPTPRLSPEGHDPQSTERIPVSGPLRRLLVWYGVASLGVYLALGAVNSVLLPL
ncbi:hypothetical protein DQ244_12655 [Blastococcus sp. TBT05-19]|uniref:hypothetical protein n=1 Tax=Blastococcus sp. TBT05-19 TaxID=2250581 RepID=UPI000DEA7FF9|nr:hypothetical protein [Blastococcus sp. TBT05-19]RBY90303.1 hypothetical protein DQ244_12655 [Blastococcus sp. TBT05-19]